MPYSISAFFPAYNDAGTIASMVVSTDLMVEGRHFRRDWAGADDVGHRAAAQNLSDINAMGGTARHLTIGLAAPADLPVAWVLDLARGFAEECASIGATSRMSCVCTLVILSLSMKYSVTN